jgi:hypothetical protein
MQDPANLPGKQVKLSCNVHNFLEDIFWIVENLQNCPTGIRELIPLDPTIIGVSCMCTRDGGGCISPPTHLVTGPIFGRNFLPKCIMQHSQLGHPARLANKLGSETSGYSGLS